ncbi:MAG: OB-fold nucleic acid binding domain-containing protein [archaeon]
MPEDQQQFKRHTAYKLRIGDILIGKPIMEGEKFQAIELGNKHIVRVNIIGNIVDKYESEGESKYSFLTIDDGSGQIQLRAFGEDIDKLKNMTQGQTVLVIGLLRYWNNAVYITPNIVKEQDPKYLLVRKLEVEKERSQSTSAPVQKEQVFAIKDKILDAIKNAEQEGGIDTDKIIMDLRDISPEIINQEIQKFISDGIVFEPRPGKVRYLG